MISNKENERKQKHDFLNSHVNDCAPLHTIACGPFFKGEVTPEVADLWLEEFEKEGLVIEDPIEGLTLLSLPSEN